MRSRYQGRYDPVPLYPSPISRRRLTGGVPRGVWLFLLYFVLTSFLLVFLWPHRVLILHVVIDVGIGLLLVLCLTALLVTIWKLRKAIRALRTQRLPRAKKPPRPLLLRDASRRHDDPHDGGFDEGAFVSRHPARRIAPVPPDMLYTYDYQTNQRPSRPLNPDQSSRF
jgi:hypothetical protein